jgi:hypothetical protein
MHAKQNQVSLQRAAANQQSTFAECSAHHTSDVATQITNCTSSVRAAQTALLACTQAAKTAFLACAYGAYCIPSARTLSTACTASSGAQCRLRFERVRVQSRLRLTWPVCTHLCVTSWKTRKRP